MLDLVDDKHRRVWALRDKFSERDRNMELLKMVRAGKIHLLMPDVFSEELPRSVVANTIDIVAQDMARVMAPLPALNCAVGNGVSAADKKRAEKLNKIGQSYLRASKLQRHMYWFADNFNSYGVTAFYIEADEKQKTPIIRVEDPTGLYYRRDRWGELTEVAKIWRTTVADLVAFFPEYESQLSWNNDKKQQRSPEAWLEVVRYHDGTGDCLYVPECQNLVLAKAKRLTSRIPYEIVDEFGINEIPRGKFDDALWVQLGRSIMAQYTFAAADQSVNSPTVLPRDVTNVSLGPGAVIFTDNPGGAGRMNYNVPREVFAMGEQQEREVAIAAQYTQARQGGVSGNIITGKGVEAMMGTFDTQLKAAQELFKVALERAIELCFELDRKLWGSRRKTVSGVQTGRPYEVTYVPARDIPDQYSCEVTYGFAAGMSPAQSMVTLLQLRGDNLIGRDTARQQLPFDIDAEREQRDIDIQGLNDSLSQGMMASAQALPALVAQGQDPTGILMAVAKVAELRAKGVPFHDAVLKAFEPPEPEPQIPGLPGEAAVGSGELPVGGPPGPLGEAAGAGAPVGPEGQLPPGMAPGGRMPGVAPGQQGMAPGGLSGILGTLAEMRGDDPRMSAVVSRKKAIGMG